MIDGHDPTPLPGLTAARGDVLELGYACNSVDLSDTPSRDDALAKVEAYADARPPGRAVDTQRSLESGDLETKTFSHGEGAGCRL